MPTANHMLTPREASRLIGISYPTIKQWILSGKLKVRIGHRYPLAEAAQAQRDLEARKTTGKVLLAP